VFRVELEKERVGSLATVRRLPAYLHLLKQLNADGREFVSSTHIGRDLKLQPDQVRKDIASTGIVGKPKSGYHVPALIHAIETFLRWDNNTDAFLAGVGNLGSALLGYKGFEDYGLSIVSAFDSSPAKVGKVSHGRQILHMSKLRNLAERMHIHLGIIAVPAESAQEVADAMASAGIAAIWNFSPAGLNLPENVIVENIDLASSLAVLSRKLAIRLSGPAEADL
jgi:redox-sensing transcriptional repressor